MKDFIAATLERHDFRMNPFFLRLSDGSMSKEEFVQTQLQFYHAVVHFTTPLTLALAAIPREVPKEKLQKNIDEENGEGDAANTHGATFVEFLRRLTGTPTVTIPAPEFPVQRFNRSLDDACRGPSFLTGLAVLGMIERMFAEISFTIGRETIRRGWFTKDQMIHYSTHEELDVIHAQDFFDLLGPFYATHRSTIEAGLAEGNRVFLALYEGLQKP